MYGTLKFSEAFLGVASFKGTLTASSYTGSSDALQNLACTYSFCSVR